MKDEIHRIDRAARLRGERGFTLVELIVAMSAGLLVSLATMILSKNATRFFQNEARISAAQLAVTLGMNRLTADLQRASFLGPRNNLTDPNLCKEGVVLPATINNLSGLAIQVAGSEAAHPADLAQSTGPENNMHPDSLILSGSFDTIERFAIQEKVDGVGITTLTLQNDGAMNRLRAQIPAGKQLIDVVTPIFKMGRILRFIDNGKGQLNVFGYISGVAIELVDGIETVKVTLQAPPALPKKLAGSTCGLLANSRGTFVSVISRIRYDIRSLKGNATYGPLVASVAGAPDAVTGDDGRTELVRVELNNDDSEDPATLELVSEYAVDLKFGVSKGPAVGAANFFNPSTLTHIDFGEAGVATTPELVRAVQVRFSTRTRAPDRDTPLSSGGRPYRFAVKPAPLPTRFARLRTLFTTVNLASQSGFQ
jgi:prepilin-type N-terminal cleavage/methylation domain-containing protein